MLKRIIINLYLLFNFSFVFAQPPVIQWQRSYGGTSFEAMESIIQTFDKGYIACGMTESNNGDVSGHHGAKDVWVLKVDSLGQLEWQKCLGGTDDDDSYSIIQTNDGDFVLAGTSWSTSGDVTGNHGKSDVWVVKLNSTGNIIWQKCFGGTEHEGAYSIISTFDGGMILTGTTDSNDGDITGNHGFYDLWLIKIDSMGTKQWQKCLGGTPNDEGWAIVQTPDSGYVVGGKTDSNDGDVSGLHGFTDFWLVKVDMAGNLLWQSCFGGPIGQMCRDIKLTLNGDFILTGETNSTSGMVIGNHSSSKDIWVVETDSLGQFRNQKCIGGTDQEDSYSICCTSDKGYLIGGYAVSMDGDVTGIHQGGTPDFWILKLDSTLNITWEQCYGGSGDDEPFELIESIDGGIVVAGYSWSNDGNVIVNHGESDVWIIKLIDSTSGYEGVKNKETYSIYPNPTSSSVRIGLPKPGLKINISDSFGKKIYEQVTKINNIQIDLSDFSSGVYFITIEGLGTRKLIKCQYAD